jgi:type IV secretory pathway protease TraF
MGASMSTQILRDNVSRFAVLGVLVYSISVGMAHVLLAHGESVPFTVFWRIASRIQRGDYVTFPMSHPIIGPGTANLTTQVVCDEGDRHAYHDDAFWCNGERHGGYISRTWDDKPLTPFQFDGPVPPGEMFVMGSHPRSFDSRYFGFVHKSLAVRLMGVV